MGNLQGSGGGHAGLHITYSPRKIYSQVISIAIFLGARVLQILFGIGWSPLEVAKTFFYEGIQKGLELCGAYFLLC